VDGERPLNRRYPSHYNLPSEQQDAALREGVVTIGWKEMPNLSWIKSKEDLEKLYIKTYPDANLSPDQERMLTVIWDLQINL
jgi:predicted Mrr-cat superfamily restriction endonuclease